jgi:peroxiredoxin Q/BCP
MAPKKSTKPSSGVEKRKAASKATGSSGAGSKDDKPAAKAKKGALAVGDHLPDFSVETDASTDDSKVMQSSKDLTEDSGAVIFFYPKANTGGCTKQALGFNENREKLEKAGYKVFGMSADKPKSQLNWKNKYNLTYTLLSDPSWQVLKSLGVTKGEKSIARSHIVVGKGGAIEDLQIGISPGDSFAKAVATVLKSSGKSAPEADEEAEEIAENAPGDDEEKPEDTEEQPKKKAKSAKGGKKK